MGKAREKEKGPAQREALRGEKALEELWQQTRKPMCQLSLSQQPTTIFDSRIGGIPYCPHDAKLPIGENGAQLRLIVQINFAQMPAMPPFPDRGILQIFLPDHDPLIGYRGMECWTEQRDWRVIYYPKIDTTVTENGVTAKMTVGPVDNSHVLIENLVYKLHFGPPEQGGTLEQEGLTVSDYRFATHFGMAYQKLFPDEAPITFWPKRISSGPIPVDWMMADDIWRDLYDKAYARYNKLGGFPTFSKADPRTILPEVTESQCPWDTVLLQFECGFQDVDDRSQGYYPISFGEDGTATFFMREKDLLRRDFSKVGYYWSDKIE